MISHVTHSVVIPTYNRPGQAKISVESALAALGECGEVIVVDDNSEIPATHSLASIVDSRLKILVNTDGKGAASARNHGVSCASGRTIFFLDDDDVMQPCYCRRILKVRACHPAFTWGYSAFISKDSQGNEELVQKHLDTGPIAVEIPIKKKLAGLGMGFWIDTGTYCATGSLDESLPVDEDTDLCLRLITSGEPAWFESTPGTVVSRDTSSRLTNSTPSIRIAQAYAENAFRHGRNFKPLSADARFLYGRAVRLAAKSSAWRLGIRVCCSASHPVLTIHCALLLTSKSLTYIARKFF
jgi:glycosyltransferase involved in cell wall biosynthesis